MINRALLRKKQDLYQGFLQMRYCRKLKQPQDPWASMCRSATTRYWKLRIKMEHFVCIVPFDLSIILMRIHLN